MEKDRKNERENSERREGKLSRRAVKETTKGKDKKVKGEGKESGRVKGGRHGNVKAQTGSLEKKSSLQKSISSIPVWRCVGYQSNHWDTPKPQTEGRLMGVSMFFPKL